MAKLNLQVGDIIMVQPKKLSIKHPLTIVSHGIRFFMKQYLKKRGMRKQYKEFLKKHNLPKDTIVTHSDLVYESWGQTKISGALETGVVNRSIDSKKGYKDKSRLIVLKPKITFNAKEAKKINKICEEYEGIPYQYRNFIQHIILINFRRWFGRKGKKADKRMFCIECTAKQVNYARPGTFYQPDSINPIQMFMDNDYTPIAWDVLQHKNNLDHGA